MEFGVAQTNAFENEGVQLFSTGLSVIVFAEEILETTYGNAQKYDIYE